MRTRRNLLRTVGGVGVVGLAGCSEGDSSGDSSPADEATATDGSTPTGTDDGENGGDGGMETPGTWRSLDGDAGHTSANPEAAGPTDSPSLETVYDQPSVEDILTTPLVDGDMLVYLDGSQIRAVSLSGDQQWAYGWGGSQSPLPTPALRDGTVYFPTSDSLVAIAEGSSPWSTDLPGRPMSSPIVTGDSVYLLTEDEEDVIVAYDHDGNKRFEKSWGEPQFRPSVGGSTLYHYREREYDENQLVARSTSDGGFRWTQSDFDSSTVPVATDGTVYCVKPDRNGAVIVALAESDGSAEWTSDILTDPVVGSPAVGSEAVYVATTEGVRAFQRDDGSAAWDEPYTVGDSVTGQPRVGGRSVYVASGDTAIALDRETGDERWSKRFGTDGDPGVLGIAPVGDRVYATLERKVVALA
ncbi:PQQ-like beta-propeller repeat protein [Halomicroarcula sp. F28]|uniref:outer membrane protein assembly factor BamB family protein n=1 Tax=Haloarcula salinisoli TaxID=2487746 RepID=UPI001C7359C2|nr:PQQ-binding-like beta-propeller repeat protein [Halomicroarcula salinisoli]MBX0285260.1 PQQ-like beta-propeller repeat protein [Halomicroarcula salinisoli]